MKKGINSAAYLHQKVPPDWYYRSIRRNPLQKFWHTRRFTEVGKLITPADKVLDIGCADGMFTKVILEHTHAQKIIGIDVLKSSVNWAKKHWKNPKIKFQVADAHELPLKSKNFDAVFCLEALEHVFNPLKVLQEVQRVLKRGGYAVILVPSESFLFKIVWWIWLKLPGKGIWKNTHLHNFSSGYLENLLEELSLEIVENKKFILGMLHLVKVVKD